MSQEKKLNRRSSHWMGEMAGSLERSNTGNVISESEIELPFFIHFCHKIFREIFPVPLDLYVSFDKKACLVCRVGINAALENRDGILFLTGRIETHYHSCLGDTQKD